MTKSRARALAPEIKVVPFLRLVDTDFVKGLDQNWRDEQAARTPLKRLATADEIGAAHWPSSPTSATLPLHISGRRGRPLADCATFLVPNRTRFTTM